MSLSGYAIFLLKNRSVLASSVCGAPPMNILVLRFKIRE